MDAGAQPAVFRYNEEFSLRAPYPDARCRNLSGVDFSGSPDKLLSMTFDSKTIWPDNLPEGCDPQQIFDRNGNPGLGVRSLHEQGNTVGVAPEANLYYVAYDFHKSLGENGESLAPFIEGLTYLLDLNELLPDEDVISISKGWTERMEEGVEEMEALVERAAGEGFLLVTCAIESMEEQCGFSLDGASRAPLSNPDNARLTVRAVILLLRAVWLRRWISGRLLLPPGRKIT